MFKKLLIAALALFIALGSALPVFAAEPVAVSVSVDPARETYIAGHRAQAAAAAEGCEKFQWKSSSPKIASVSDKGVILFKKPGTVTITASCKGKLKGEASLTLVVAANEHAEPLSRVYLKGNFVYADILLLNETAKPLKKLGKTEISLVGVEGFETFTAVKGAAKKAVKPGESGFFTFKLMKTDKSAIDLTAAVASIKK